MEEQRPNDPRTDGRPPRPRRNVPMMLLILGLVVMGLLLFSTNGGNVREITFGQANEHILRGDVDRVRIVAGNEIYGTFNEKADQRHGKEFHDRYTGPNNDSNSIAAKAKDERRAKPGNPHKVKAEAHTPHPQVPYARHALH